MSTWNDDLEIDTLTPPAILLSQASLLGRTTGGVLDAEVTTVSTVTSITGQVQYQLDLIAPALRYRHRVLTATHDCNQFYPMTVAAECFQRETSVDQRPVASSEREFIELVQRALGSDEVRSLIRNLIDRSNARSNAAAGTR